LSEEEHLNADCPNPNRPYLRGVNLERREAVYFRPRCKLWACPVCGPINKGLWVVRAYHGAESLTRDSAGDGDPLELSFLTITSHRALDAAGSVAVFQKAWNRLRGRAARRSPDGEYMLIPERHQDGRLHAHAIETYNLGTRFWKDAAASCGLGYIAEEEEVRSARGAARYANKYIAKTLSTEQWPSGFRRVRTSRGWPKLPDLPPPPGWVFEVLPRGTQLDDDVERMRHLGFTVTLCGHRAAWEIVAPEDTDRAVAG
jgi:hypothetical protein